MTVEVQTQYLDLEDGRLAFSDYGGSGQAVLMLPGMAALRSDYRFLAPLLAKEGYHALAVDLRGQGETSVPWPSYDVPSVGKDILKLIERLGLDRAHLIGNSFSAAPIVWAAVENPSAIRTLVLINPFVRQTQANPLMSAMFWLMLHNPWRLNTWMSYVRRLYPSRKPEDFEEYLKDLKGNLAQPGRFAAASALGTSSRQHSDQRLEQVTSPALVVMGSRDPDFPDPAAEGRIVAERTGGKLAIIDGAGHYPQSEMPEETASVVIGFLNRSADS